MPRALLLALAAGLFATATPPATRPAMPHVATDTIGRFPRVDGSSLEGEEFHLPAGFRGELNVVLVAFKREQQEDVDSWTPLMRTLAARHERLRVYELPTLGRRYRLVRPFIDGGMRRGIPDAAVRAATITLYIDKGPFRDALRIEGEDRIAVLLVDREGVVHWRGAGRWSEAAGSALAQRIEASLGAR